MLHLYDQRSHRAELVIPARRGELRMYTCGPAAAGPPSLGELCSLLLPDLIRRVAERQRLRPVTCRPSAEGGDQDGEEPGGDLAGLRAAASALNFHPPGTAPSPAASAAEITRLTALLGTARPAQLDARAVACAAMVLQYAGETVDIHTGSRALVPHHENVRAITSAATGHEVTRLWVHAAPVAFPPGGGGLGDVTGRGLDPLALRLALLGHRYSDELKLTWADLDAAAAELARWRGQVADWARSPSKPISGGYHGQVTAAFDDDLDTPSALTALRALEGDPAVDPGSKFETFADADRLLGLDLAQDVGRY